LGWKERRGRASFANYSLCIWYYLLYDE